MKINLQEQLERAVDLLNKGEDLDTAESIFNALLNLDTDSPTLLFYLGSTFLRRKFHAAAGHIFRLALEKNAEPENAAQIWNNLGFVLRELQSDEEALKAFKKALELRIDPDFYANIGAMLVGKGVPDEALEYLDSAVAIKDDHAVAHWNKGLCELEKGNYKDGWVGYDWGLRGVERIRRDYGIKDLPFWDGTPGKTVVVYGEQGIGDELMFCTILPDLMAKCNVILDAHPRLADMFRESFPNIPVYGTRKDKNLFWCELHKIDAQLPIGSLGRFFRNKPEDFPGRPYLKANPKLIEKYQQKLEGLGHRPKIGISWLGGTKRTGNQSRKIPLDLWLPLMQAVEADYISLQYTPEAASQVGEFNKAMGYTIHHWQDMVDDYDETAALVSNLDLVISVPQSVVHLAGSLGVPTWQLTPKKAMWQMGVYGQDMPWYHCVRNFWQDETETWEPVINTIKEELCHLLQMSIAA